MVQAACSPVVCQAAAPLAQGLDANIVLLASTVALLALGLAFAQARTSARQQRLALFDKRWAVYASAKELLAAAIAGKLTAETRAAFIEKTAAARWLFNDEVDRYLKKDLLAQACHLGSLAPLRTRPRPETRALHETQEDDQNLVWLAAQHETLAALMGPFLRIEGGLSQKLSALWAKPLANLHAWTGKILSKRRAQAEEEDDYFEP